MSWPQFVTVTLNGLTLAALYFVVAIGFTLIFGVLRVVNLAHGSFYLLGGYVGWTVADRTGSWVLGAVAALVAAALGGLLLELGLLRRIHGQDLREALVTIGVSIVAADLMLAQWGGFTYDFSPPDAITGGVRLPLLGIGYPKYRLFVLAFALALGLALWLLLARTRLGIVVRAAIDDRDMVAAVGIDVQRLFALMFAVGAGLAGLAGVVGGSVLSISSGEDARYLLASLIVVIVGGMGSLPGTAVAALLVALVEQYSLALFPTYAAIVSFLLMVVVLVVRPQGLFGRPA
ncbi:MAG: branched-chain amino acid ABC transporter permease [Thermomicrobium sp.]|nr:branched-chain amino acid ABC transporter permease [Thermomicrobium sp.]MDW8060334.1 branched-chain amino acid ABC transporter permease [Thermomicrobium sp.]